MDSYQQSPGTRFLFVTAAFVIVVAGMKAAESLLVPFLLSLFIAIIAAPPMFWLKDRGIPSALALLIVLFLIVTGVTLITVFVGTSVNDFTKDLPIYQQRLKEDFAGLVHFLDKFGIAIPDQTIVESFDPGAVMGLAAKLLNTLSGVLTNAFFILLTATFILLEASSFPTKLQSLFADPDSSMSQFNKLTQTIKRYLAMKSAVSLLTGAIIAIWLAIIGVEYPVLWGLLAFLFNYVPNIGSIIAAVPAILMALVQSGIGLAGSALIGYIFVNVVVGNVVEPRVMGRGLGLSTLVVFLSLVFWGWVLGPVGMLLSVPLTMVVKIALESYDQTHWIAVLMGPESEVTHATEEEKDGQRNTRT